MSFGLHYIQGFDDIQMYAHYKYFFIHNDSKI